MAETREAVTNELIFELLKQIHATLGRHTDELREIRERLGTLEVQYANLSRRVDRMDERLTRIEARLGLVDS